MNTVRMALAVTVSFGAAHGVGAQTTRVIFGYTRDTVATTHDANGAVLLHYQDPQGRVITVSIRPMKGAADTSAGTAAPTDSCVIAYAEKDSIPIPGGHIWGHALARACLVNDSTVIGLVYTYPVRDNVLVFQSNMTQAQWNTSRFEPFVCRFVQDTFIRGDWR